MTLENITTTNTGLAKLAVQNLTDKFSFNQSFILRININSKNPAHRKSANHWQQL
jgi:hypothetical protein